MIQHVEDKIETVLEAYLRSKLAAGIPIAGVTDSLDALDITVGLDTSIMPDTFQYGRLPLVEVYAEDGEAESDVLNTTDHAFRYRVAAVVTFDGSDPTAAAKSATRLANCAAGVLVERLVDPIGTSETPIWDCRLSQAVAEQAATFDDSGPNTCRASAAVVVRVRTEDAYTPTYATPVLSVVARDLVADAPPAAFVDASPLDDTPIGRDTTVEVASAELAAASIAGVDMSGVGAWPAGSTWSIWLQRHRAEVSGDFATSGPRVDLSTYDVQDGDGWVVTTERGETEEKSILAIHWSVT